MPAWIAVLYFKTKRKVNACIKVFVTVFFIYFALEKYCALCCWLKNFKIDSFQKISFYFMKKRVKCCTNSATLWTTIKYIKHLW